MYFKQTCINCLKITNAYENLSYGKFYIPYIRSTPDHYICIYGSKLLHLVHKCIHNFFGTKSIAKKVQKLKGYR